MPHVHSWRRLKGDTFICAGETCYLRLKLAHLHKKLAECPSCEKHFIIDITRIKNEAGQILCGKCREDSAYQELTLEEQKEAITRLIKVDFEAAIESAQKEIAKQKDRLLRRESKVQESAVKLSQKWQEFRKEKARLQTEFDLEMARETAREKVRLAEEKRKLKEEARKQAAEETKAEFASNGPPEDAPTNLPDSPEIRDAMEELMKKIMEGKL